MNENHSRTLGLYIAEKLAAGEREIALPSGRFEEKLHIETNRLTLTGDGTVIAWDDCAKAVGSDGEALGTFRSYTAFFRAEKLRLEGITVENTAGPGEQAGQAVAAYFDCREGYIKNCVFRGWQDTIFTAPLPERPVIPNSFKGPNDGLPRNPSTLYFENCLIEGDVDFIFGGACAVFENCEIKSLRRGYAAAPSTPASQRYGYIFLGCDFTGADEAEDCFVARPWRKDGACALVSCRLGKHISPYLWNDWDSEEKRRSCRFFSEQAAAPFGQILTEEQREEILRFAEETKRRVKGQ